MKYLVSLIIPSIGVVVAGGDGKDVLVNIALCVLGFIPGVLHAWYICATK